MLVGEHNELTRSSSKFRCDVCFFYKLNLNIYAVLNDKGILLTYKKKKPTTDNQTDQIFISVCTSLQNDQSGVHMHSESSEW